MSTSKQGVAKIAVPIRFETTVTEGNYDESTVVTEFPDNPSEHVYTYTPNPGPSCVAVFGRLSKLPGNCNIGVSHDVFVRYQADRGKGYGRIAHRERMRVAREHFGFNAMLCTVHPNNSAQIRILITEGWVCMGEVANVLLYKKELRP